MENQKEVTMAEIKLISLFKLNYTILRKTLEIEKLKYPETYGAAVRFAEDVRRGFILSTGTADDFPPFNKD